MEDLHLGGNEASHSPLGDLGQVISSLAQTQASMAEVLQNYTTKKGESKLGLTLGASMVTQPRLSDLEYLYSPHPRWRNRFYN